MKITLDEIRRVASLAHLEIDAAAADRLRANLDQILDYVDQLDGVDTSLIEPALGITEESKGSREDQVAPGLEREDVLANAPESGEGHFKVPRVIPG